MDVFAILLTIALSSLILYIYITWKTLKTFEYAGIPYAPGLPILGNITPSLFKKRQIGELLRDLYESFSNAKYFGMFDLTIPIIVIRDNELIKQIAIKNFDNFTDHLGFTIESDTMFSQSLFSLRGERWREMRGLVSPGFTSSKLKQMFSITSGCAKELTELITSSLDSGITKFEMKEYMSRYTFDVICGYTLGVNINAIKISNNEIFKTGREIFTFEGPLSLRFLLIKSFPSVAKLFNMTLFTKKTVSFFSSIIDGAIDKKDKHGAAHMDLLQILVNAWRNPDSKVKVDMNDILAQFFLFFLGGFETSSSYLSSTLHLLATHPEIQARLVEEIDEIYEKTKGNPTIEDIQAMEFMERVLLEAGRIYPPVPYLERLCTKDFDLPPAMPGFKSTTIKPGTTVYFPTFALHHDPEYFPNPEKFDPDRFLNKSINYDCGYYMPFGVGRRICIGTRLAMLNMKLLLFYLLAQVTLKPSDETVSPMKLSKTSFVIMSHNKVWLEVEKRMRH